MSPPNRAASQALAKAEGNEKRSRCACAVVVVLPKYARRHGGVEGDGAVHPPLEAVYPNILLLRLRSVTSNFRFAPQAIHLPMPEFSAAQRLCLIGVSVPFATR
jgi:hypothetical protein